MKLDSQVRRAIDSHLPRNCNETFPRSETMRKLSRIDFSLPLSLFLPLIFFLVTSLLFSFFFSFSLLSLSISLFFGKQRWRQVIATQTEHRIFEISVKSFARMNYRAEPTDADRSLSCMQRPLNFNVLETRIRRKSLIKSAGKVIRLFSKLGVCYRFTLNFNFRFTLDLYFVFILLILYKHVIG